MNTNKFTLLFMLFALLLTSCSSEDDATTSQPLGVYENGILIAHEGNFGQGNASVSFVSSDLMNVDNGIFSAVNSAPLGDTAQSIAFDGDLAYIVLNVSNTIEIVNRYTFESVGTINTGLNNPRFIAFANNKGYVTNWGDGTVATDDYVAIIDLSTNMLESQSISVEEGPEAIITNGNMIYIAHKGGFSQNNIISVIDTSSNLVTSTITVGDVPNSLELDALGNLWVLSGGKPSWTGDETGGQLSKIDTSNNTVTSIDFGSTEHPNFLTYDNGNLYYYMSGSLFSTNENATVLPTVPVLSGLNFYGMTVKNATLYGVDAADFASNGSLSVYDLDTNVIVGTVTLGIIPASIYFN